MTGSGLYVAGLAVAEGDVLKLHCGRDHGERSFRIELPAQSGRVLALPSWGQYRPRPQITRATDIQPPHVSDLRVCRLVDALYVDTHCMGGIVGPVLFHQQGIRHFKAD